MITAVLLSRWAIGLLVVALSAVFFYLPFSGIAIVPIWLIAIIAAIRLCPRCGFSFAWVLCLLAIHVATLAVLFFVAPKGGGLRSIDTSGWNGETLEYVCEDLGKQTGLQLVFSFVGDTEKDRFLQTPVAWERSHGSLFWCLDRLTEQTPLSFRLKHGLFFATSLSGHYSAYEIVIYRPHRE